MDLDGVIDPLYDLAPAEFVPARDAAAKAAKADGDAEGAAEIAALRRPTVLAWLTNQLARRREEEMAQFLELGAALREATAALSGPELRELSRQRQALVTAMVREARTIARDLTGSKVTEDVARGLEETLLAALADPDAAELVRMGRLSGGLEQSGFGVGSGASTARPAAGRRTAAPGKAPAKPTKKQAPAKKPAPAKESGGGKGDAAARRKAAAEKAAEEAARRREEQRAELEASLGDAWAAARAAAEVRDDASAKATAARDARREAERRLRDLETQLREAREGLDAAEDAERAARDERDRTETAAETARKVVTDLQGRLDAL